MEELAFIIPWMSITIALLVVLGPLLYSRGLINLYWAVGIFLVSLCLLIILFVFKNEIIEYTTDKIAAQLDIVENAKELARIKDFNYANNYCKVYGESLEDVRINTFNVTEYVCTQNNKQRNDVGLWMTIKEIDLKKELAEFNKNKEK